MTQRGYDKSVILRKMYVNNLSLTELYQKLGDCEYIEDLHIENSDKKYIIGTIRKPYKYDAKRIIGSYDVTGQNEYKFFKFLIKEELDYFLIACHYEFNFGGFSVLKNYLVTECKDIRFEIIYRTFGNIKISDLKKIEWTSKKYTKEAKHFGIYKKIKQECIEVSIDENTSQELATPENLIPYIDIPDENGDDENISFYIILKNNKRINMLQPRNTHFKLENLKYKNDLPEENDFVTKVYKIWEKI